MQFNKENANRILLCKREHLGALAGTGGTMAVTRRNSKTTKAAISTKSTTNTITQPESEIEIEQHQAQPAGQRMRQRKQGAKADPKDLATILSNQAMAGNAESIDLLDKLEHKSKPTKPAVKKRTGLTLAQRWALEPPWPGDSTQNLPSSTAPKSNP
jgi:hypothetical protein